MPDPAGTPSDDAYSIGVEEEYFVVDAGTRSVTRTLPEGFLAAAKEATQGRAMGEFLQSQVEAVTRPHHDIRAALAELRGLRQSIGRVAAEHGLAIVAAGTHPTADWGKSEQSEGVRYDAVMDDLQMIGQRNMLCGMHVHVQLPDDADRVDVMMRMLPYLPLIIALSTSSPFWRSHPTGLEGYRLAAYDELPRTGVPELFRNQAEFEAYVDALVKAGVMKNSSYIWWLMRPSLKHPTLELRAPDTPTRIEDSIAIAALYRCLARCLCRDPGMNADIDAVGRAIVVENKWRAQRYGVHGSFVCGGGAIGVGDFLEQVIARVADDAQALDCVDELHRCRAIVASGTSADAQMKVFDSASKTGSHAQALRAVTDWLVEATLQ